MTRVLLAVTMLAAFARGAGAGENVVQLRVAPMPEPKPALKYQLLPEVREVNSGNAAHDYLKCFMEQRTFYFSKQGIDERSRYLAMPLAELRAAKIRNYGGQSLRLADRAARMRWVDWQTLGQIPGAGLDPAPAPELGPLEVLALALKVRFRAEVAEGQYDDAIHTAKTILALGRHLGEYPSSLASQLGIWVARLGLGSLEEMVQQPGCPNLYWALTDLPCPLVDLRRGAQGDTARVAADLRAIRGDAVMTEAELETCVGHLSGVIGFAREQSGHPPRSLRSQLTARAKNPEQVNAARLRLFEAGSVRELVQKLRFPPLQVILLDEKRTYEIRRDARLKFLALPLWQADATSGGDGLAPDGGGLFDDLLPRLAGLRRMQGALEQEVALLRHVEALRLHAAAHSGRLPAKLSDVCVPLQGDPVTGTAFEYTVEGETAHLRGGSHTTGEGDSGSGVHFQVTVRH